MAVDLSVLMLDEAHAWKLICQSVLILHLFQS